MVTDARGLPLGFAVAGANVPDYKLLEATLDAMPVKRPEALLDQALNLCLDKGYDITWAYRLLTDAGFTPHVRAWRRADHARAARGRGAGWWRAPIAG